MGKLPFAQRGQEALEADKEHRAMLLNEFIPYLKLHCNLSEMERILRKPCKPGRATLLELPAILPYASLCCRAGGLSIKANNCRLFWLRDFDVELAAWNTSRRKSHRKQPPQE